MGTRLRSQKQRHDRRLWLTGAGLALVAGVTLGFIFWPQPPVPEPVDMTDPAQVAPPTAGERPGQQPPAPEGPRALEGVRQLASGTLPINLAGYDVVANGLFALVGEQQGEVRIHLVEWRDGSFHPIKEIAYPAGKMLDVSYGDMYNEGFGNALVTTEQGLLFVQDDGRKEFKEQAGLLGVYVGDYDGDGHRETAYFQEVDGTTQCTLYRHYRGGRSEKVGAFRAENMPRWTAATVLDAGGRRLLLGASPEGDETVSIGLYTIDPAKGLEQRYGGVVPNRPEERLVSSTAAVLGGRAAFAVSYRGNPSYVELFDIAEGSIASRGRIDLPSGDEYFVMAGRFTGPATELLAITRAGNWTLYGF